jgi:murein L,D-transpeptidase YcbB/YkuD
MNRLILLSISVATALAVAMPAAEAEIIKKKKRSSFFETIFAGSYEGNSRERKLRKSGGAWWQRDGDYGVRILDDGSFFRNGRAIADLDPEADSGYGMGNLNYSLPKTVAVFDSSFATMSTVETVPTFIRLVLSDKETPIRASEPIRKVALDHYRSTGFRPLWTTEGKPTARAEALLQLLAKAGEEGLNPDRYLPAVLTQYSDATGQIAGDGIALAQLDVGLTIAALTYARHISGGAFEPERLSRYHDLKPDYADPGTAIKVLAYSPFATEYLQGLAPAHPAYGAFKTALAELAVKANDATSFPGGKRVKAGQKDVRIRELRKRLEAAGFVPSNAQEIDEKTIETLDKQLVKVLKAYQKSSGSPQTGNLDQSTVRALNGGDSPEVLREKLITNMERIRWLPKELGRRHVFVNQASFTVNVMENGKSTWTSKVIVGKPNTQTSVFSDEMETVVFNPTWGMPQSILLNEYLPKLRYDPSYLDRKGFQVVNAQGRRVSSSDVDWYGVGKGSGIGVVQPAGGANALGEIKFLFPNSHSIYMHDTPNRELFAEAQRSFSHGCVRVENPKEFAQVLLRWDAASVDKKVNAGKTLSVKVPDTIKVHLAYFTAWPDDSGKIQYFSDIYGRDETLGRALKSTAELFGRKPPRRLVQNASSAPEVKVD